jgi:hypothetical protein
MEDGGNGWPAVPGTGGATGMSVEGRAGGGAPGEGRPGG